jgi:hypothetical protein
MVAGAGDFIHGYSAYGNSSSTPGGTNVQSGITSSYFAAYNEGNSNFDFRLTQSTNAGLDLTSQSWWSTASDSFFGTLDSAVDMYGNTRGTDGVWDRGAYEHYSSGKIPKFPNQIGIQ